MRLQKLHLLNFKNYAGADVELDGDIHVLLGRNGEGKTNLLEAIHYLSLTRGIGPAPDAANVRQGEEHFLIRGLFEILGKQKEVTCTYTPDRRKKVAEDGKEYTRFSEHIGKYPIVLVTPGDIELVWDGGEIKRRFFDTLLSQLDREYLGHLMVYQVNLKQRNGLLRMSAGRPGIDRELLATYDERLVISGQWLHARRAGFVKQMIPRVQKHYAFLVNGGNEVPGISYASHLDSLDFGKELVDRLDGDVLLGRTSVGMHRDEFRFTLNDNELKSFGSQGQQKSFLIALKLAEFDLLSEMNGFKPLLMLDDIFDKLDDERIVQLLKLVANGSFGQIFLTDARPGRSLEVLKGASLNAQCFQLEKGQVTVLKRG